MNRRTELDDVVATYMYHRLELITSCLRARISTVFKRSYADAASDKVQGAGRKLVVNLSV